MPAVFHSGLVHTAGMTPRIDGLLAFSGRVGEELDVARAGHAAALAAQNALAAAVSVAPAGAELRCLKMTVFIACSAEFTALSQVADAASRTLVATLGERGRPARSAIGVRALPSGAPVEVELVCAAPA